MLWTLLNRIVFVLIFLALLGAAGLQYVPLLRANQAHRAAIEHKKERVAALESRHKQLQASIESLRSNPQSVERAAREVLSCARPDEWVVTFENNP